MAAGVEGFSGKEAAGQFGPYVLGRTCPSIIPFVEASFPTSHSRCGCQIPLSSRSHRPPAWVQEDHQEPAPHTLRAVACLRCRPCTPILPSHLCDPTRLPQVQSSSSLAHPLPRPFLGVTVETGAPDLGPQGLTEAGPVLCCSSKSSIPRAPALSPGSHRLPLGWNLELPTAWNRPQAQPGPAASEQALTETWHLRTGPAGTSDLL